MGLIAFALAVKQPPLYTSNQNTYFLHGLARSGQGSLAADPLATATDPFPLFSALVRVTAPLEPRLFHVLHWVAALALAAALTSIARRGRRPDGWTELGLLAFLGALFSGLLGFLPFCGVQGPLVEGCARQYVLGPVFQPSVFGVLLVVSLAVFLAGRPTLAVVTAVSAAAFHAGYLPAVGILVLAYLIALRRDGAKGGALLRPALTVAVLAAPVAVWALRGFAGADPDVAAQARRILVEWRFPHHALPAVWLGWDDAVRLALVAAATLVTRKERLGAVLATATTVVVVLTGLQALTDSHALALLFPWRVSAVLSPVAAAVLLREAAEQAGRRTAAWPRGAASAGPALILLVLLFTSARGLDRSVRLWSASPAGADATTAWFRGHGGPDTLVLVPPERDRFRIAAAVPVYADRKTHPYRPSEVVAWYERVQAAAAAYADPSPWSRARIRGLPWGSAITHVVLEVDAPVAPDGLRPVMSGDGWEVWEVRDR